MPPIEVETDHTRSTGAYPPANVNTLDIDEDTDYSRSTGAYPMDKTPKTVVVEHEEDLTKSTMAYPMYDDPKAAKAAAKGKGVTITEVGNGALETPNYPTPGPVSIGLDEDRVAKQRAELGLSPDPTGESDHGYEARPSTVAVPGADGIDRDDQLIVDERSDEADPGVSVSGFQDPTGDESPLPGGGEADDKSLEQEVDTKVIEPPASPRQRRRTQADGA